MLLVRRSCSHACDACSATVASCAYKQEGIVTELARITGDKHVETYVLALCKVFCEFLISVSVIFVRGLHPNR